MTRLEMKNCNVILTGRLNKYQYCHLVKLINTCDEILSPDQNIVIEKAKLTYYPLGKAFEKQGKTIED